MDMWKLWHTFQSSGRVDDYLRYRGIDLPQVTDCVGGETQDGNRAEETLDDRRSDNT